MSKGQSIVITSGKGGTGKTSTAAGIAACLAAMGYKTLCIDTDIGLRNLDLTLGMSEELLMDFTDVIQKRCTLKRACLGHPTIEQLYLLTAPVTLPEGVDESDMTALLREVREAFDYCIIDCPAGVGRGFSLATCAADQAVVVCNPDSASLRDGQATAMRLRRLNIPLRLVVNRVKPRLLHKMRMDIDDVMDTTGLPLLGVVPEDEKVPLAAARGVSIITATRKGAARAYYNIAKRITGDRVPLMRI